VFVLLVESTECTGGEGDEPARESVVSEFAGPGRTTRYPSYSTGIGTLGLYLSSEPAYDAITASTVLAGPNIGLTYVLTMPGIPASTVWITHALTPRDAWYDKHPTDPGMLDPLGKILCTRGKIDLLRVAVERHEGLTSAMNSHYGVQQLLHSTWNIAKAMGGHVIQVPPDSAQLRMREDLKAEWKRFFRVLNARQAKFDTVDTPRTTAVLGGCSIFPE
jgi:hypothetical protein